MMKLIKVYDLKEDNRKIEQIQNATRNTEEYGLDSAKGLFGSEEWWSLVKENVINGVISKVYMSGHNDFPEFEVKENEKTSSWERLGDDKYYIVGKRVKIVYTKDKLKKPIEKIGEYVDTVLKIEIEE